SVVNITQLFTIDKEDLIEFWGQLPSDTVTQIDAGLRLVLHLKEN
ncbi:MAG: type II toxin-antitoxin system PemK/MazF family toxin, partial [Spirochaetes bacterium]|nr:type II toxin-antitoxin system PemK/MazF family toxin [Spirochaetota bacterium]